MKIAVGLSGGIDSTTAILKLHNEGHDVIGITMKATQNDQEYGKCCSIQDVHDAKWICQQLGVRHYVVDVRDEFKEKIIQYFFDEYLKGRTPNPCIFCNELIKFQKLIEASSSLGYNYFATGHYAILERDNNSRFLLKKGLDPIKDQAYFLSRLPLSILGKCIFPLGNTRKEENIQYLASKNISISQKRESHEICFVPGDDYSKFIEDQLGDQIKSGHIIDEEGSIVGEHNGIPYYTIGQRRGLNIAMGKPVYVREIHGSSNTIVIGDKPYEDQCEVNQLNWLDYPDPNESLLVKVRYFHEGEIAHITKLDNDRISIQFENPVFSITKGQAAVGYRGDQVIFSGIID